MGCENCGGHSPNCPCCGELPGASDKRDQSIEGAYSRAFFDVAALRARVLTWWNGLSDAERRRLYDLDKALNARIPEGKLPGRPDPGMTISERVALAARRGDPVGVAACRLLNYFDENHCEKAIRQRSGPGAE